MVYILLNIVLFAALVYTEKLPLLQKILRKCFYPYNSPGLILNSILCFLLFMVMEVKSEKINLIASSVFSIYLIHANKYVLSLLRMVVAYFQERISWFIVFLIFLVAFSFIVCLFCVIIDKIVTPIRYSIGEILYKKLWLYKIDSMLERRVII
jgi:hypothetical protein